MFQQSEPPQGRPIATQFRYSSASFWRSLVTAVGLTLIISFLVWLFSRLFGLRHADVITLVSGGIFFGFCSAAMIWRYWRDEVVVAIRPGGLFDARHSADIVAWDAIKDVRLRRAENDFEVSVHLWPDLKGGSAVRPAFVIDLAPLDVSINEFVEALSAYKPITLEER